MSSAYFDGREEEALDRRAAEGKKTRALELGSRYAPRREVGVVRAKRS
jgi:hypothetical protein